MRAAGGGVDHGDRLMLVPAAYDDRLAAQFRIAQQLDRRKERVHVEVGDNAGRWRSHGALETTRSVYVHEPCGGRFR